MRYIGARYVPLIMGEWDNTKSYEPLSVVVYQGNSYTSKKNVPIGVNITDTNYWVRTGNYNQQVEQMYTEWYNYKDEMDDYIDEQINKVWESLPTVTPEMYGAVGDGVTDDTQALQNCIDSGANYICANKEYKISELTLNGTSKVFVFNKIIGSIKIGGNNTTNGLYVIGNDLIAPIDGNGLHLISTSSVDYIQHCYFNIKRIYSENSAGASAILMETTGAGAYINDNRFTVQWSVGFNDGIKMHRIAGEMGQNQFSDTDMALNPTAFNIISEPDSRILDVFITDCRFGESYGPNKKSIKTTGRVTNLNIINAFLNQENVEFSNETYGYIIGKVPTAVNYHLTRPISSLLIRQGIIVPQNPTAVYKNLRGDDTSLSTDANGLAEFINFNFDGTLYIPEIYKYITWPFYINIGYLTNINFWGAKTIDVSTGYTQWKWYKCRYVPSANQILIQEIDKAPTLE